jgi:predicted DNA-binding transcriptional regulator AlpA
MPAPRELGRLLEINGEEVVGIGATAVGQILGVSRQRVYQLVDIYADFPKAVKAMGDGALWDRDEIEEWAKRDRRPGRPPIRRVQERKRRQ